MLLLTRQIRERNPEWVNIHINYADNPALSQLIRSLGGSERMLDNIYDIIKVQPMGYQFIESSDRDEVILGFDAPRHVIFRRSEIDA
jgi:hypothetical protein